LRLPWSALAAATSKVWRRSRNCDEIAAARADYDVTRFAGTICVQSLSLGSLALAIGSVLA
jgi:hypothetical protein